MRKATMNYSTIKVMKALRIVYLFVIVAIVAACSSTEDATTDKPSAPTGSKTYTMTINANKHGDTRALTLDGKTLNSSWKKGEQVKVIGFSASTMSLGILGMLEAQGDGVSTTLSGEVDEPYEGSTLQLVFPRYPYDYTEQKGTLDDIAAKFDYATCEVAADQWELTNGNITTKSSVLFSNATQAIVKFNLQNSDGTPISASSLTIHDANGCILQQTDEMIGGAAGDLTINLDEPSSEVWVAISSYYYDNENNPKKSDLTLTATVGSYNYTYTKSDVTFEHGKYYSITVKMNLVETDELSTPLTLEAIENGTITFSNKASGVVTYKVNDGASQIIEAGNNGSIAVYSGDKVSFYGDNATYYNETNSHITCTNDCYVYGNIMSLISSTNFSTLVTISGNKCFYNLFHSNSYLKNHPDKKILLPATTLTEWCYYGLFEFCSSLTTAPALPATKMEEYCYANMFSFCSNLTVAPELPATTLADYCYSFMFYGCQDLTTPPILSATTLASHCYEYMFRSCTSLSVAPQLSASVLTPQCYYGMFQDCTSLTTAPELPATTLAADCYCLMFYGCSNLTAASELPAKTLAEYCYAGMFQDCTSLTTPPSLAATTLAENCYSTMFKGCTSLTTAPELPATTLVGGCYNNMFLNCSSLTTAPELPATTLIDACYSAMFKGCTSLTTAPELPATTLASSCYTSMFNGCTSLTTAPTLPVTSMRSSCYRSMFAGCTGLTTAPTLPATGLSSNCYQEMFKGCTGLSSAPNLPATTLQSYCYAGMFSGCTALTTSPELPAETLKDNCYKEMFKNCTNLNKVTCLATNISAKNCTKDWLSGVSASGKFYKPISMRSWTTGVDGIPSGWTAERYW